MHSKDRVTLEPGRNRRCVDKITRVSEETSTKVTRKSDLIKKVSLNWSMKQNLDYVTTKL